MGWSSGGHTYKRVGTQSTLGVLRRCSRPPKSAPTFNKRGCCNALLVVMFPVTNSQLGKHVQPRSGTHPSSVQLQHLQQLLQPGLSWRSAQARQPLEVQPPPHQMRPGHCWRQLEQVLACHCWRLPALLSMPILITFMF